ncbi:TIGR03086 family metal-binding protein [Streptacidiphilus neutrinimicus]|uniref:TIGR03086 family metal-binding protein n=1 Tax=Streptacidiphilus neutrinimicus TaxID=105420 RepID=UPI0005A80C93|nr:TIGR03086 family metal-binding protein [Streptacidiphilus neutrinimicus]
MATADPGTAGFRPVDFRPATDVVARLVRGVREEQLDLETPCGGISVGRLLDHIDGLSVAFAAAARKERLPDGGRAREPDASRLGEDWRDRLAAGLDALAGAWRPEEAWEGVTMVGGLELPAPVAGASGLDEVLVHGWDLAAATRQPFPGSDRSLTEALETAHAWVGSVAAQNPEGVPGLFGPSVAVPEDAPLLDRLLALTGRDPGWEPGRGPVV